jgi:hypothetical protein
MSTIIFSNIYSRQDYSKIAVVRGVIDVSRENHLAVSADIPEFFLKRNVSLATMGFSLNEAKRKIKILRSCPNAIILYRPQRLDNLLVLLYAKVFKQSSLKIVLWENYGYRGVKSSQKSLVHKTLITIDLIGVKIATAVCDEILVNNFEYRSYVSRRIAEKMRLFPNPTPLVKIKAQKHWQYAWGLINVGTQDYLDYANVFEFFKNTEIFGCLIGGERFGLKRIDRFEGLPIETYFTMLSSIDVLVVAFPSTERNDCRFPNKLVDAIFYGRKILCSSNPFLKSVFAEYENIYWYSNDFDAQFKFAKGEIFNKKAQDDFIMRYRKETVELIVKGLS